MAVSDGVFIGLKLNGAKKFGIIQADKYFDSFFEYFDIITERPFSFEAVDYLKRGYRRCVCGVDSNYFRINEGTVEIKAIVGRQDLHEKLYKTIGKNNQTSGLSRYSSRLVAKKWAA